MTTGQNAGAWGTGLAAAWRTRDILVAAVIGVVFGVVFLAWGSVYYWFAFLGPLLIDWSYGMWFVPAILAALIIRKPGAALFAEIVAAALSTMLGSAWSVDTVVSGVLQGAAAELVFAALRYRDWSIRALVIAAVAAATAAWIHDWIVYYAGFDVVVQAVRLGIMAASAIAFAALGTLALERSLRRAGVLEGFPA